MTVGTACLSQNYSAHCNRSFVKLGSALRNDGNFWSRSPIEVIQESLERELNDLQLLPAENFPVQST